MSRVTASDCAPRSASLDGCIPVAKRQLDFREEHRIVHKRWGTEGFVRQHGHESIARGLEQQPCAFIVAGPVQGKPELLVF